MTTHALVNDDDFCAKVSDVLPEDFKIHEVLGKGSNNTAFRARWNGRDVVFRAPRRHSDTQQKGSAKWEYLFTQCASDNEIAPKLLKAWYSRHTEGQWSSGLYMVMDHYPYDLEKLLIKPTMRHCVFKLRHDIGLQIVNKLERLAEHNLFVYDLKPSNIVLSVEGGLDVRFIDFGKDFCEWKSLKCAAEVDSGNTPVLNIISRLCHGDNVLMKHISFATMLLQLSSTTTRHIYEDRREHRMNRDKRLQVNPTAAITTSFIDSMQGKNKTILRSILRCDEVRSVLKHYHGRRNGGTRRTLQFATGEVA
jgi:hypothetical protein